MSRHRSPHPRTSRSGGRRSPRRGEILTDEALAFVAELQRRVRAPAGRAAGRRVGAPRRGRADRAARLPARDRARPRRRVDGRAGAGRPRRSPGRDHRADGPKMAINALNSGAQGLARRPRGREHAALVATSSAGRSPCATPIRRPLELHRRPRARTTSCAPTGGWPSSWCGPRGWHLDERHLLVDGAPPWAPWSTSGCTSSTTPRSCSTRGSGPYFYLPKMESHLEARLWNDVFTFAAAALSGIPHGTIRATVLIETIPAAFEMEEILYELRDHASGLNAGRWDYLFSVIKYFRDAGADFVLPDRASVTDDGAVHARLYRAARADLPPARRLRDGRDGGVHPEPPRRRRSTPGARQGPARTRSARPGDGFDGSWVAHPDLVPVCQEVFDAGARRPAEPARPAPRRRRMSPPTTCSTSRRLPGAITRDGLRSNVEVALLYLESWLGGNGAVAHPQPDGGRRDRGDLAAPRSGSGCTTGPCSTTARRSPPSSCGAIAERAGILPCRDRERLRVGRSSSTLQQGSSRSRTRRRLRRLPDAPGVRGVCRT